uniref:Leucine-rich repeat-containing N-terminal plant-type domain-containing protein n=1 Tax=Noccaea caerulescens TaxID=107243 RepID=A0A1J3DFQ8_NOCCA
MKKPLVLALLLVSAIALPDISNSGENRLTFLDQRLAVVYPVIQRFKSLISLDPFKVTQTWTGSDICSYRGFHCDNPPDNNTAITVASIDFNGFQLSAPSIEGFIDQFPDLALFHVNSNNFGGTVPSKIVNLKYLYELDISNNEFTGQFPNAVVGMPGLTFLDIRFNSFSGSIPPQVFGQNLDVLFINDNTFTASLPEIPGDSHILFLTLADNKFNGPLPRSILRSMSTLTEVLFLNNDFTGCVPYEIGLLKEASVIDIGGNKLTGPLPLSLMCLEKVEHLNFAGNLLFGAVPEAVCMLLRDNLVNLSLSDNYFTHVGPWCKGLLESGVLDVKNNCIPFLPGQRSIEECAEFFVKPKYYCPHPWFHSFFPCRYSHMSSSSSHGAFMPVVAPSP